MTGEATRDTFLVSYRGGPLDGAVHGTTPGATWPLPDTLTGDHVFELHVLELEGRRGHYQKVGESQLPENLPGVLRGAAYEWVEGA